MTISRKELPIFKQPSKTKATLNIKEGSYFYTRGGWVARIVFVVNAKDLCYAVHNPGTPYESEPIVHEVNSGFAIPRLSIGEPPAYTGHPADLTEEIQIS